jgi:L-cysteine desulfidase
MTAGAARISADMRQTVYTEILRQELIPAMGCTEPIALAYAASIVRDALGEEPLSLHASISGNIIKNVKSVVVPMTGGLRGIEVALAAGLLSGRPDLQLQVLRVLDGTAASGAITELLTRCRVTVGELDSPHPFDLLLRADRSAHTASVRISGYHTNVVDVTLDGENVTARYAGGNCAVESEEDRGADRSLLTVEDIVEFAQSCELDELRPILRRQIEMNTAIAEEGLRGD